MAGLERVGARAMQDREVHADALLQNMLRTELERQGAELRRETQREVRREQQSHTATTSPPSYHGRPSPCGASSPPFATDYGGAEVTSPPRLASAAPPAAPDPDQVAFGLAAEQLSVALKAGDGDAAQSAYEIIRVLHERRSEIVSAGYLAKCVQCVSSLLTQLAEHRRRVAALAAEAVAAARAGDAAALADFIRRLNAIHAAHPRLLDDAGLEQMRVDVAQANEGREDGATTRKLMDRERAVASEMKRLASAVSDFHRAVSSQPEDRAEFQQAARLYLRALRATRLHEKDWLAEFVLELGDMLANWNVPPPGAEQQIDRFLERVREALQRIHAKMSDIDRKGGGPTNLGQATDRGEPGEP